MTTKDLQNILADYIIYRWVSPTVFYIVAAVHFTISACCFLAPRPLHTVGIENVYQLTGSFSCTGILFLMASLLGFSAANGTTLSAALRLIPQQFLLILGASRALMSIFTGEFADGSPYPIWFILADQIFLLGLTAAHSVSICGLFVAIATRLRHLPEGTLHL